MHVQWIKSKTVLLQNWTQFNSLRPEGVYLKKTKEFPARRKSIDE